MNLWNFLWISLLCAPHYIVALQGWVGEYLKVAEIWKQGYRGAHVHVAVLDSGATSPFPGGEQLIVSRHDWTRDAAPNRDDIGHGTFVAGLIGADSRTSPGLGRCKGLAPEVHLSVHKVFDKHQNSYTSSFMDAFDYVLNERRKYFLAEPNGTRIDILNLSVGGPDAADHPFIEKIKELTFNGILVISATGNDGPLAGTVFNPADLKEVLSTGSHDDQRHRLASFSSRGMTTSQLPHGYGHVKPDVVVYGNNLKGPSTSSSCRSLSGTSVSCPVITGIAALLASAVPRLVQHHPMRLKQAFLETSQPLEEVSMYDQGAGSVDPLKALQYLLSYQPHITVVPAQLDMRKDCTYYWPHCSQPLYYTGLAHVINFTLLDGIERDGQILTSPHWKGDSLVDIEFQYSRELWPFTGYVAAFLTTTRDVEQEQTIKGTIELYVSHEQLLESKIVIPLILVVRPCPKREKRVLWDVAHSLRYPPAFVPRDSLDQQDQLDWTGDHPHTNFRSLYKTLRTDGYFIEIATHSWTCYNLTRYDVLLLIDPEQVFAQDERSTLYNAIEKGLGVVVIGEWYNEQVLTQIENFDDNTQTWWIPVTGGSTLPALNLLLEPYGMAFGTRIYKGHGNIAKRRVKLDSSTCISRFPAKGRLLKMKLQGMRSTASIETVPVLGYFSNLVLWSDSYCIDEWKSNPTDRCEWLLSQLVNLASSGDSDILNEFEPPLVSNYTDHHPVVFDTLNERFQRYSSLSMCPIETLTSSSSPTLTASSSNRIILPQTPPSLSFPFYFYVFLLFLVLCFLALVHFYGFSRSIIQTVSPRLQVPFFKRRRRSPSYKTPITSPISSSSSSDTSTLLRRLNADNGRV